MKKFLILLPLLVLASCGKQRPAAVINIYHTAGAGGIFWSRQVPAFDNRYTGGYAVLKNFLNSQPGKKIVLDGGDWFSQTPEGAVARAAFPLKIMKNIGYDAAGISFEDVNPGWPALYEDIINSGMTVISSNVQNKSGKTPARVQNFLIKDLGGVKAGVFSLIIKEDVTAPAARLGDIEITDEADAAQAAVSALKSKGADIIILLVDAGGETDFYWKKILDAADGIDVLLTTAGQRQAAGMEKYGNAYVVKTAPFLTQASKLRLLFDNNKKITGAHFEAFPLFTDVYGEDEDLKQQTAAVRQSAYKKLNRVVAKTDGEINNVADGPGYLGELAAGCIKEWAKADFAVINSDSLRSAPAGKITEYSLYEIYPYADSVMIVRVRGEEIKNILEASLASKNNFPQISGLKIDYDAAAPDGQKIKKILINGAPPAAQNIYRMAVTDHIMAGGFGTDEFINAVEFKNTNVDVRAILRQCFSKKKTLTPAPPSSWKQTS